MLRTNRWFFRCFWKSCHFISQMLALTLWSSSGLKWNWASLGSLHILLAVEFYQATTSCFATLLYSGPLCSTCQCGFSLPTRPWLPQAYLCWRLSDEQKPIKVFKWMLLFSAHTIEIFHVFNCQPVKDLAQNDNGPRRGHKHNDLIWQRKILQITLEAHPPKWECGGRGHFVKIYATLSVWRFLWRQNQRSCQKMYSGVLLLCFVLVEYIMTNKDCSGLGTEDWAICRLEFIFGIFNLAGDKGLFGNGNIFVEK